MEGVVIDTNVFVAAGFNPGSAAARILAGIREGRFRLVWNGPTRRETEMILRRIPRLDWEEKVADLFRPEGEFTGLINPDAFTLIADPDDRKFAALSAAASAPLVTSDKHVLAQSSAAGIDAVTPTAFLARENS
jgi:predicted nucleic acid-binding protein